MRVKRAPDSPELLDGELDVETLAGNLRDLARVNRWLGGADLSVAAVMPLVAGLPAPSVLDVGTGAADIPARLARPPLTITATDVRPEIVELASLQVQEGVEVRGGRLEDEKDALVRRCARIDGRASPRAGRRGFVPARGAPGGTLGGGHNDLARGRRWWFGAWLLTRVTTRNAYTRHDAPLSVRRAYTADEVIDLARQAGLRPVARYMTRPAFRYALVFVDARD